MYTETLKEAIKLEETAKKEYATPVTETPRFKIISNYSRSKVEFLKFFIV